MGMVADELPAPVGPEFKKTFDQQNFGLPLKEALNELAERVPLLDVRFFATAVTIQRETGGNLPRFSTTWPTSSASGSRFSGRCACTRRTAGSPDTCCWRCRRCSQSPVVHQPRSHEPALHRADGQDDADGRRRDAGGRLLLDPASHQDRGVR